MWVHHDVVKELSAQKEVVLTVLWFVMDIFLHDFLEHWAIVNADHYFTTLQHLKEAIQRRHRESDPSPGQYPLSYSNATPGTVSLGMSCQSTIHPRPCT
jgi:hypothetical protein